MSISGNKLLKEELLLNQNYKLKEECVNLKEKYQILKRKLSQRSLSPLPSDISKKQHTLVMRKLRIYESDYTSLNKSVKDMQENSNLSILEQSIKRSQDMIKTLEKDNYKLNISINKPSLPEESEFFYSKEISKLKSSIIELEQTSVSNSSKIDKKKKTLKEHELEYESLVEKNGGSLSKKSNYSLDPEELEKKLRSIQNSFALNQVKYLNTIAELQDSLSEVKKKEIILRSTLIKKQQQLRLISAIDKDLIQNSMSDDKHVPDVNFYYKPALKHLYI